MTNSSQGQTLLKQSPLAVQHKSSGGKLVPFAGWELPVQFQGLKEEHLAVRRDAGIFDVSHMGEVVVAGPGATDFLNYVTCNSVETLAFGQAQYSALLTESGGVIDDIIVYREGTDDYFICVNASNAEKDVAWLAHHAPTSVSIADVSSQYGQIALQGPASAAVLASLPGFAEAAQTLKYFHFCRVTVDGKNILVARTGYTGEDGFELFIPWDYTSVLWEVLQRHSSVTQCGLGARDTLRLEAAYPLHGHELSETVTALESGLGWIVKEKKEHFIGKESLIAAKQAGLKYALVGFFIEDKGIARHGDDVVDSDGTVIGTVTSGTKTPTVGEQEDCALGLALIPRSLRAIGTPLSIKVRSRVLSARVAKTPFYSALKKNS